MRNPLAKQRLELTGESIAPGRTLGKAFLFKQINLEALAENRISVKDAAREIERLDHAVAQSLEQLLHLLKQVEASNRPDVTDIFRVQLSILEDIDFLKTIRTAIHEQQANPEYVLANEIRKVEATFHGIESEVLRSRFLDIQDVHHRLLRNLLEIEHVRAKPLQRLHEPVVLIADRLLPSDIALLELNKVLGIVIEEGSTVSHVAIIAKSLGIPAMTQVAGVTAIIRSGDLIILDAGTRRLIVRPGPADLDRYEPVAPARKSTHAPALSPIPCQTTDGVTIALQANAGSVREAHDAFIAGADGIGLLRTEFFYMSCPHLPHTDEEVAFYRDVAAAMHWKPTVVRLLDLGADKTIAHLTLPREENPQLGIRGVRLLLRSPELFRNHLLSILKASKIVPLRLLLPFVTTTGDLDAVLALLHELRGAGDAPPPHMEIGIMVEIPAVALGIEAFLDKADFVSIGTNDLVQYVFAASREDGNLDEYRIAHHPTILRLIAHVVTAAHGRHKPVSVCGEMASDPLLAALLVGLGVRALSMPPAALQAVRRHLQRCSCTELEKTAAAALLCSDAGHVLSLLQDDHPA